MPTTFVSKLFSLGLGAALGAGGLFGGLAVGASDVEQPPISGAPLVVSVADAEPPAFSGLLANVSPSVLADPAVASALSDPAVRRALSDPAVIAALLDVDPALLTRPAVLEAIRVRRVTPALLSDPVVAANLPALLRAMPAIERALAAAPATGQEEAPAAPAAVLTSPVTPEPVVVTLPAPAAPAPSAWAADPLAALLTAAPAMLFAALASASAPPQEERAITPPRGRGRAMASRRGRAPRAVPVRRGPPSRG